MSLKVEALKFKASRLVKRGEIKVIDLICVRALDLTQELKDAVYSLEDHELENWSRFECRLVEELEVLN